MLLEFSVENYRSIKEEQILSMVKSKAYKELKQNTFTPNAPNTPDLLKTAVIYGANAAGKSNILRALFAMQYILKNSFKKQPDENIATEPFLFDHIARVEPTTFSITLVLNLGDEEKQQPTRVQYGFSLDKKQVYEEWLSLYPKGREQAWFHRIYDDETETYEWAKESAMFKGQKTIWKENTRKDQLFLSTAVHLNSEQLKPIYEAIVSQLAVIPVDRISSHFTEKLCKDEKLKNIFLQFLQQSDIDVTDIKLKNTKVDTESFEFPKEMPQSIREKVVKDLTENGLLQVYFVHQDNLGGEVEIALEDESDGTQKLFEFIGPIFETMLKGEVLIIDEFNKSLHPDLLRHLVKLFNSTYNKNNGQLIFTTHETAVLRKNLLRRDQIWLCEKDQQQATTLAPLSEFKALNREDLEESYLHGRYGAKPVLNDFSFIENIEELL